MNYTKGEWEVNEFEEHYDLRATEANGSRDIAHIFKRKDGEANANLIAAAPDMYEALKAQHEAIDSLFAMLIVRDKTFFPSKSGQPWEAIQQGNQALSKAEGK